MKKLPKDVPSMLGGTPARKKVKLYPYMARHNERTRVQVIAGYLTADVGPRTVVISKMREATDEDRALEGHAKDKTVLDTVIIRFDENGKVTIKSHVTTMGEG